MINGILCVDKPRGMSSHDVVDAVRRLAGIRAVGHTGTLDPDASGLLLLCLGRATKFARFFEGLEKIYWTVMRVGMRTDTQDATGSVLQRCEVPPLSREQLEPVLHNFTGSIRQTPPMYSAVKHQGQRLYRLARQGQIVARSDRSVFIRRLQLVDVRDVWVTFSVTCSKGTYVRTLCEDMGLALGYGAHMAHLQRCQVGPFHLGQAYTVEFLQQQAKHGNLTEALVPLTRALNFLPSLSLTAEQYNALPEGQGSVLSDILADLPHPDQAVCCYRLLSQRKGTFAVMHRPTSTPGKWKLSYVETPSSTLSPVRQ